MTKVFTALVFALLLLGHGTSYAQKVADLNEQWLLITEEYGVKVFAKKLRCFDPSVGVDANKVILKVENTSSSNMMVSWDYQLYHTQEVRQQGEDESRVKLILSPASVLEGKPQGADTNNLTLFHRFNGYPGSLELTTFIFKNLTIKAI